MFGFSPISLAILSSPLIYLYYRSVIKKRKLKKNNPIMHHPIRHLIIMICVSYFMGWLLGTIFYPNSIVGISIIMFVFGTIIFLKLFIAAFVDRQEKQHSWFLAGLLISPALWFPSVRKSLRSLLADKNNDD